MIIVKTKNGDVFINQNEAKTVQHDRMKRQVIIDTPRGHKVIDDVECMMYSDNISQWIDEGSEVAKLHGLVHKQEQMTAFLNQKLTAYEEQIERYETDLDAIDQALGDDRINDTRLIMRGYPYRRDAFKERLEGFANKYTALEEQLKEHALQQIEADNELVKQHRIEVNHLKADVATYRVGCEQKDLFIEWLLNRNLWQRITNKAER